MAPLKKKEKKAIPLEFLEGVPLEHSSPGRGHVSHLPPLVMTEAAYVGALWTLWVKLRGVLGEIGDGEGLAVLTLFNLCWQFQFPAEKDISHSCLNNPNHNVLSIKLVTVTLLRVWWLAFWRHRPLPSLLLFTIPIKTPICPQNGSDSWKEFYGFALWQPRFETFGHIVTDTFLRQENVKNSIELALGCRWNCK